MAPKIVLGLYTGNTVHSTFGPNIANIVEALVHEDMYDGFIHTTSSRIDSNRNFMIDDFLTKTRGDFLFIIDEDMVHPAIAPIVLASRDKPIISGLYFRRDFGGKYSPVIYSYNGKHEDLRRGHGHAINDSFLPCTPQVIQFLESVKAPAHDDPVIFGNPDGSFLQPGPVANPLLKIDASGFGCLLIRRDALEQLSPPYLLDEMGLNGDLVFGRNAMNLNIEYWADMSVVCTHFGERRIGIKEFSDYSFRLVEELQELERATRPSHHSSASGYINNSMDPAVNRPYRLRGNLFLGG